MPWFFWLVGPLFTLSFLLACLFWFSWRNQNSPLVKKGDRWRPSPRASLSDFDPNAADAFPLADYAPGVIVSIHSRTSLAPIIPLPERAPVLRFPIERVDDAQTPPPPPAPPTLPRRKPRLHVLPPQR
jgi:hypothetical protein